METSNESFQKPSFAYFFLKVGGSTLSFTEIQYLLTLPAHFTELLYPTKSIIFTFSALFDRCSEKRTGKQGQRERGEDMRQRVGLEPGPAALSHMACGQESLLLKMKCLVS